jgi:hypothetical protein
MTTNIDLNNERWRTIGRQIPQEDPDVRISRVLREADTTKHMCDTDLHKFIEQVKNEK